METLLELAKLSLDEEFEDGELEYRLWLTTLCVANQLGFEVRDEDDDIEEEILWD